MNDNFEIDISPELEKPQSILEGDTKGPQQQDSTIDLSYADAMQIIIDAGITRKSKGSPRYKTARDSFLDYL